MPKALVNLRLNHDMKPRHIINEVAAVENVEWVRLVFGSTDAIALIETDSWAGLETTAYEISAVEGVLRTDTRILVPKAE